MLATPELIREAAQLPQLEELLPRWREVPLYRDSLGRCKRGGLECFKVMPLLAKRDMQNGFPQNFLSGRQSLEVLLAENRVELEHTSGTSEERLPVIFGRGWWSAQEERALRLNSFVARILDEHPNARRATLVPPACNGLTCPTVWMSREQRTTGNTLFVNLARIPFLLSDADLVRMAAEIAEWSPQFLDMDPVHGVRFALYCEQHGIRLPSVRFVLCSYEFVSVVHRRILTRVFDVPVFNLYGSTETGHLLMENERGEMKPSYDTAFLEVVNPDEREVGELVVTTLSNDYMPLLRYRIGDLAERIERPYGNNFVVHGRARDALTARNRRRITTGQADQCFAGVDGIMHYELRQVENGDCVLRYVPDGAGPADAALRRLGSQLGTLLDLRNEIKTESMRVLLPAASGKFRLTRRLTPQASKLESFPIFAYPLPMLVVHVHVRVKLESIEAFKAATLANARASVQELGITRFDVIQQQDDPARFVLVEVYRDANAATAHKETSHYPVWRDAVAPMMVEPRRSVKFNNLFPEDKEW